MKKPVLFFSIFLGIAGFVVAQEANVSLSNIADNNGFGGYNASTKTISGIYFDVLADGDKSENTIPDFQVSLYLLACDESGDPTSETPVIIKTYDVMPLS